MNKHCLIILASYEYETLQMTFKALDHTIIEKDLPIVIILNGENTYNGTKVERISREWASAGVDRYVVKPQAAGTEPLFAVQEVINDFPVAKNSKYILKIDDDLIPLKKGWVTELAELHEKMEAQHGKIGFVTGLINNNTWGFNELLTIYNKRAEYERFMNHPSRAGVNKEFLVPAGKVNLGLAGTVWQYPSLAAWLHEWTSFDLPTFVEKTKGLGIKEVDLDTHYSIGCIYSARELWEEIKPHNSNFDELLIHRYCLKHGLRKFALMSQPFVHLYYFTQRLANSYLIPGFMDSFASYFNDPSFKEIKNITLEDRLIDLDERMRTLKVLERKFGKIEGVLRKFRGFLPFKT